MKYMRCAFILSCAYIMTTLALVKVCFPNKDGRIVCYCYSIVLNTYVGISVTEEAIKSWLIYGLPICQNLDGHLPTLPTHLRDLALVL